MQKLIILLLFVMPMQTQIIFNFDSQSDINNWRVLNDAVMGGSSSN